MQQNAFKGSPVGTPARVHATRDLKVTRSTFEWHCPKKVSFCTVWGGANVSGNRPLDNGSPAYAIHSANWPDEYTGDDNETVWTFNVGAGTRVDVDCDRFQLEKEDTEVGPQHKAQLLKYYAIVLQKMPHRNRANSTGLRSPTTSMKLRVSFLKSVKGLNLTVGEKLVVFNVIALHIAIISFI